MLWFFFPYFSFFFFFFEILESKETHIFLITRQKIYTWNMFHSEYTGENMTSHNHFQGRVQDFKQKLTELRRLCGQGVFEVDVPPQKWIKMVIY